MSEQARALRLAECLLRDRDMNWPDYDNMQSAAAELCRLHSVNAELLEALQAMLGHYERPAGFDKAMLLSDEQFGAFMRGLSDDRDAVVAKANAVISLALGQ